MSPPRKKRLSCTEEIEVWWIEIRINMSFGSFLILGFWRFDVGVRRTAVSAGKPWHFLFSSLLLPSAPLETHWGSPGREMQSHQVVLGLPLSSLSWTLFPGGQAPEHVCVVRADAAPLWALPTRLGCSPRLLDEHSPLKFTILIT